MSYSLAFVKLIFGLLDFLEFSETCDLQEFLSLKWDFAWAQSEHQCFNWLDVPLAYFNADFSVIVSKVNFDSFRVDFYIQLVPNHEIGFGSTPFV